MGSTAVDVLPLRAIVDDEGLAPTLDSEESISGDEEDEKTVEGAGPSREPLFSPMDHKGDDEECWIHGEAGEEAPDL